MRDSTFEGKKAFFLLKGSQRTGKKDHAVREIAEVPRPGNGGKLVPISISPERIIAGLPPTARFTLFFFFLLATSLPRFSRRNVFYPLMKNEMGRLEEEGEGKESFPNWPRTATTFYSFLPRTEIAIATTFSFHFCPWYRVYQWNCYCICLCTFPFVFFFTGRFRKGEQWFCGRKR